MAMFSLEFGHSVENDAPGRFGCSYDDSRVVLRCAAREQRLWL